MIHICVVCFLQIVVVAAFICRICRVMCRQGSRAQKGGVCYWRRKIFFQGCFDISAMCHACCLRCLNLKYRLRFLNSILLPTPQRPRRAPSSVHRLGVHFVRSSLPPFDREPPFRERMSRVYEIYFKGVNWMNSGRMQKFCLGSFDRPRCY